MRGPVRAGACQKLLILYFDMQSDAGPQKVGGTVDAVRKMGQTVEHAAAGVSGGGQPAHDEAAETKGVLNLRLSQFSKTALQKREVCG